jgi:hypothetical protein
VCWKSFYIFYELLKYHLNIFLVLTIDHVLVYLSCTIYLQAIE